MLRLCALLFAGFVVGYLVGGFTHKPTEFPFVANSVAKDGMFAILAFVAAGDVRRNGWAAWLVIAGHAMIVATLLTMLAIGRTDSVDATFGAPFGLSPDPVVLLLAWAAAASLIVAVLTLLCRSAARARYKLRYLAPHQHRTAMALAEVLVIGPDELLTPEQVAEGIDDYLASFSARGEVEGQARALGADGLPAAPRPRPPFALMSPERRLEFIERCFHRDVVERRLPGFLRKPVQSMLFGAQQLAIIGYYGDPRTAPGTGYVPFSRRPRYGEAIKRVDPNRPGLNVRSPNEVDSERITADVAIIGSGAAGAILAQRLLEAGREVTILEGGRHVDPHEFSEDERVQFSALFSDGGMQMSRDARFQVLQAKCVGGGTVINNAVCFDLTDPVARPLERSRRARRRYRPRPARRLVRDDARNFFPVRPQDDAPLNKGGTKLIEGVEKLGLADRRALRGRRGEHPRLPRQRLLQHRLSLREEASMRSPSRFPGRSSSSTTRSRSTASAGPSGSDRTGNGTGVEVGCKLSDGRRLQVDANKVIVSGGGPGLEPAPPAQRPRRQAGREEPLVQRRRPDDRRLPPTGSTPSTASRSPTPTSRRTRTS